MSATLLVADRLLTCEARGGDALGSFEPGAVLFDETGIHAVGSPQDVVPLGGAATRVEHRGLVTPGLVDAHTHAAWMGSRAREYGMRMAGADYETIAAAGGGIVASMRAIRAASRRDIAETLAARLARMASLGVTTVEVKSGYGLSEADERKQLEAIAIASENAALPRVVPTFLGLHALPPEARTGASDDRVRYAGQVLSWLDGIAQEGLAAFVDAYVDRAAFSVTEVRPVLLRARELGLGVRLHIGQFADVGGAALAAEVGAASVDHLEHLSAEGAALLAATRTAAVLLPTASFTLGQAPPDVPTLRAAGVSIVVASDANPGTAPTESLPLAMALAARAYGLDLTEIILGVTARAASSLGTSGGRLAVGAPSDLVLWSFEHEAELLQPWGLARARAVYRGGRSIA